MIRDDFHLFFVFLLFNVVERQYKKKRIRDMDENNVPEMRPTFEEIRKVDGNGKEYWTSRELCNAMGYSGYWKFQNVIDKAIKVASEKGMDIDDHFNTWLKWLSWVVDRFARSKLSIYPVWLV